MSLTDICIRRPVLAWMLMAATVVFGGVAASRIGISQFPDVDFPTISISVSWEGATPEAIEHDVVEVIEEAVTQVEGIKSLSSTSRQGSASITVELELSRPVDLALQDVEAKVSQAAQRLPRDINPPVISKTNPEDNPIMWIGLSGPFSQQILSDYARYQVKEKLQTVPGVGEITLGGYLERNVRIWVDATKLEERRLTVGDITAALRREHVELPAGYLDAKGREINVRVMGEALNLDELRRIVVRDVNGARVYLSDVALVEDGFEDQRRMSRVEGNPVQGMGIRKQRGSNAVAVAQAVHAQLDQTRQGLPDGMSLDVIFDSTKFIEESVQEIETELLLAIGLTALVCWIFLGSLSSTLNVVMAIPMSLLGTVAVIYFLGFTLNTFTLLGLSLAVGIVVDDAIMVLENIYRHAELGKTRVQAARDGTHEITFAALAATLAVVAIFIPVVFMRGVIGRFFLQFGVTLCVAVLISYIEAITLAPARCAQMLRIDHEQRGLLGRAMEASFHALSRLYRRALRLALRAPLLVLVLSSALVGSAYWVFQRIPTEFVPSQDQGRISVRIQAAVGADLDETNALMQRVEQYINAQPEVDIAFFIIGGFGGGGVNTGTVMVTMIPKEERSVSQQEFSARLRKELNSYPGVRAVIQDLSQSGFTASRGFPVEFSLRGPDFDTLASLSEEIKQKLQQTGAVVDIDTDYRIGLPELRVTPDRARAADLGVSIEDVASTLNSLVGGVRIGKYSSGGRRVDVRLQLLAQQRARPEDISKLSVRARNGDLIPLSALVQQEERPVLQGITRRDRERAISVFGNIAPGRSQGEAIAAVQELTKELPPGYRVVLGGASVTFQDSIGDLLFALLLGVLVAYMVLASQFNSFLHPVTVLTILVPSVAGAVFALWLWDKSLNIFSMIGLLLLMGIVKKNSIILVDYALQLRASGMKAAEAMIEAGPVRLRPILMTSMATMMAAVPSALALGAGAETRGPMAVAVIGGLVISTGLSLVVVPCFYVLSDRAYEAIRRWRGSDEPPTPPVPPSLSETPSA
jgi:hydrophobe/amphiphile efflux-1 (HAE1) family protein